MVEEAELPWSGTVTLEEELEGGVSQLFDFLLVIEFHILDLDLFPGFLSFLSETNILNYKQSIHT